MILKADSRYLWLPVRRSGLMTKLQFFAGGSRFQEIDLPIGQDAADYYAAMDVHPWLGQEIEILGDLPEEALAGLRFSDSRPENEYPFRSRLHFTAETGWINDPNGLVYADGVWHLYHQWNPRASGRTRCCSSTRLPADAISGPRKPGTGILSAWPSQPTAETPSKKPV